MIKNIIVLYVVICSVFLWSNCYAIFSEPDVLMSADFGVEEGQIVLVEGYPSDFVPEHFLPFADDSVVVSDGLQIKLFNKEGLVSSFSGALSDDFTAQVFLTKSVVFFVGSSVDSEGSSNDDIYVYDYQGRLQTKLLEQDYIGSIETVSYLGFVFSSKGGNYYKYSSSGELLVTYNEKPQHLGVERSSKVLPDDNYLQVIEYEDLKFNIVTPGGVELFDRDQAGYFYGVESVDGVKTEWRYRVHKFDQCSRKVGYLDLPENDIRSVEVGVGDGPSTFVTVIEEYGPPIIGSSGSIYAWKRTHDTYSILKWEWVDDPSDPQGGPEPPSNLATQASLDGILLTWEASPQDPGCVDSYEVERATSSDGIYSSIGSSDAGILRYNDTTTLPGETVYYRVRAKSGGEYSNYTAVASGKRP